MTSSMLRRQLKNLVQNYSEAEVKVREATSNDPWGPSSSQMADISDLTYNVVACNEIMTMLWKRLKDDRNWRHIHKSLTLLEYLLKTGDERVLLKMKDNVYIVKALTEYRFVEKDGKDQGANVREKAKAVLVLMEDDDKLKEERDFAVKTREKTSKGSAASSSDAAKDPDYKPCYVPGSSGLPSLDNIPSVADLAASFAARKDERLKQEQQKKEAERRAKMSEDDLKWEDAGKGGAVDRQAWSADKTEEDGEEGAAREPRRPPVAPPDPWGAPSKPDAAALRDTSLESSAAQLLDDKDKPCGPFQAQTDARDPFVGHNDAPKHALEQPKRQDQPSASSNQKIKSKDDPFSAPKDDPFNAPKDDPFNAPKDDPFNAPKDDPFNAPKDDPFNAPKEDPFNAPKDDPFNVPKDDPFNDPKDDPFNAPKDDPFNAPKDDPFNAPKDDPFNAPKDDPFNASKDDPFNAPKDDPFNAPTDDPFKAPKDDPFNVPKDDPFNAPKNDPFTAPKDDPFNAPKDDPFSAPKADPFNATKDGPFNAPKDDPFDAPKDDPFDAPKDDPFSAPKDDSSSASKEDPSQTPKENRSNRPKDDPSGTSKEDPFSTRNGASFGSPEDDPFAAPAASAARKESPAAELTARPKDDPFRPAQEVGVTAPPLSASCDKDPFCAPLEEVGTWRPRPGSDPWGGGASSPVDQRDPFGDAAKAPRDPWGAPGGADAEEASSAAAAEENSF